MPKLPLRKPKLYLGILLLMHLPIDAQNLLKVDNENLNNQYWLDFIPHFRMNSAFEFYSDVSFRVRDQRSRMIAMVRPSLKWQALPELSVHAGFGFFYNIYNDSNNVLEIRPWQGLRVGWPKIGPLQFKNFLRFEERYYPSIDQLITYRARYKLSAKIPLNRKIVQNGAFFIPIAYEWLASSDHDFNTIWTSETRFTTGFGHVFNREWQIEFELMLWWTRPFPEDELKGQERVFRLKLIKEGWVFGE